MFEGVFGSLSFASFLHSCLRIKTNKPSLQPSPLRHSLGKVLMEYRSGICPLQANLVLSSKQTVLPSPKRLRKDVLAKDESESQKPLWLLMESVIDHHSSVHGATWGITIWQLRT